MTHYYMRQNLTDKDRSVFAQKMILRYVNGKIIELVKDSPLSIWEQQNFLFFKSNYNDIYSESFMSNKSLFDTNLKELYNEIETLPEELTNQVINFIEYLKLSYIDTEAPESVSIKSKKDLKEKLQKGLEDIKANKLYSLDEVFTKIENI